MTNGRMLAWLLLGLVPARAAPPEPHRVKVTFQTEPMGAQLYDYKGDYLGRSGDAISLQPSAYGAQLDLTVRLKDYQESSLSVRTPALQDGAVLPKPALHLIPQANPGQWLRSNAPPALGLMVVGAGIGLLMNRQRIQVREQRRREEILSEVDQSDSMATKKLGKWRLLSRLGRGGMATVYRAVPDATLKESEAAAIKVMRREILDDPEAVERFRRESIVTARLDHPNIVRLLDWGEEDGYGYMVMELISGGNLRERMGNQAYSPADAWAALQPLCAALTYAHGQGIVHRDLKPENLMVTDGGVLKVADFGLARTCDQQQKITKTGTALGTPAYMSPEQIQGDEPVPAMDQYAVGVLAYELVTGRVPFSDPDVVRQIFKTLTDPPQPPSQIAPVSTDVDAVILKMLQKRPEDRFESMQSASRALEKALA